MMRRLAIAACLMLAPSIASAAGLQDRLAQTVLTVRDRATVLAQITDIDAAATATLARTPGDADALLTHAMVAGYRAKLNRSRQDALAGKAALEALVARNPRDPQAQEALGGWHLDSVAALGGLTARSVLGARKATGLEATDRAVALGGDRATFAGLAAMLRLSVDPADPRGGQLAETAAHAATPTALDRIIQRRAIELAAAVKGGDRRYIQALARRLLPLGQVKE